MNTMNCLLEKQIVEKFRLLQYRGLQHFLAVQIIYGRGYNPNLGKLRIMYNKPNSNRQLNPENDVDHMLQTHQYLRLLSACPATKIFQNCPTACPKTCNDLNPSFCIEVCPVDKYCVCREGMVQLTSEVDSPCVVPSQCPGKQSIEISIVFKRMYKLHLKF